ncbi:MAG: hypothetical protein D6702_11460 [Planctomycetota bacterium]|nr:MAG: hypothetical protein D6702_11460 [Planctomycetota bacterium]
MRAPVPVLLLPLLLAGGGCAATISYEDEIGTVYHRYSRGEFERAARLIQEGYEDHWRIQADPSAGTLEFSDDAVVWNLERGKILLDAGRYRAAYRALESAETVINQVFAERAVVDTAEAAAEAEALLTNQKALPYEGTVADRILLNTYKALAAVLQGDLDQALIEARRIEETQDAAIRDFAAEAEQTNRAGAARGLAFDQEAFLASPRVREDLPWLRGADAYPPSYRDFLNPYALLVKAVLRRIKDDPNESPLVDLRNLASMRPDLTEVVEELERVQAGEPPTGRVYVLYEGGLAPVIESVEYEVPYGWWRAVFGVRSDALDLLQRAYFALPVLRPGRPAAGPLVVADASGREDRTVVVAEMEPIMRYEFERRYPVILMRELLRVLVQETASHEVRQAAQRQDDVLGAIAVLGGLLYQSAMNRADDRSWRTLPAAFGFLTRPLPADGRLTLRIDGAAAQPVTIDLAGKDVALIYARSVNGRSLTVHQVGFIHGSGGIQS